MARRVPLSLRRFVPLVALGVLSAACGPVDEENMLDTASAEVSEHVSTVVNVTWTTEKPSMGYVEYGPTKALGLNTPMETEESLEHKQPLIGLKPDTVYYYRVVAWDGDGGASEVQSIRTGYLPPGLPQFTVTGTGHDEFVIVPVLGQTNAVLIIDPAGDIVWNYADDSGLEYYRARLALDGKSILYNAADLTGEPSPDSAVVRVSFDGSERSTIPIPLLAHDFVEHSDGTIGALVVEDREDADGTRVRGNKIVEVDLDGNQRDIWTSWDCFDFAEEPGDDPELGWTFANALDYDAVADAYYMSLRNFSSIVRVNRQTAECEWVLGFTAATLDFAQGSARFQHEHQFHVFGDRLLVMDNEGSLVEQESRIIEYQLDLENNVATEVWRYLSSPPVYTWVLGEPNRLLNGDTFINWSTAGQMERVTESGENVWKLNATVGGAFGFHSLSASLYSP